jgi:Na+-driven multidrug efflux pump
MMLTINTLRNIVVHEGFVMGPHEMGVVGSAMATIEEWSARKSKSSRVVGSNRG